MDSFNINISPETQEIVITQGEPINISINEDVIQINQTKENYNLNLEGEVVKIDANYPQAVEAARIATEKAEEATQIVEGFDTHAQEKIAEYDSNASDKIAEYNQNATQKTNTFNSNATSKTGAFNQNASDKTDAFNSNATSKTGDFNDNATAKTTAFNENATSKTTVFNENASEKQALVDASAQAASQSADEAKQWAIGDPSEPTGNSAKYWAEQSAGALSGLTTRVSTIEGKIPSAASSSNQLADKSYVDTADNGLQSQIDAIVASSDVFDIVGTYAELQAYDISTVPVNDIIKVLVDSTHNDAATYYRCVENSNVKSWSYIGSEGAYYTKSETNTLLSDKQDTLVSGTNIKTVNGSSLLGSGNLTTSAQWGGITGTLSNQTDLQNALDGTVKTTGNQTIAGDKTFTGMIKGEAANNTNHAIDLGHNKKDYVDFYEYGGIWNFYKSMSGTNTLVGKIAELTTSTSDETLATTANVDAKITAQAVKLTGDQMIAGIKTFTTQPVLTMSNPQIRYKDTAMTRGTAPLYNLNYTLASWVDKDNNEMGYIQKRYSSDGYWGLGLQVTNGTVYKSISIAIDSSGNVKAEAPTPATSDNSNKIATTAYVVNVLKEIYPVGSCFIGTTSTCPLAALFGTWTLKSSGIVTSVNTNVPVKGNGMTLGLTNGSRNLGLQGGSGKEWNNDLYTDGTYGKPVNTGASGTASPTNNSLGITTDSSKSGIVGTVTRSIYTVNIWERTA